MSRGRKFVPETVGGLEARVTLSSVHAVPHLSADAYRAVLTNIADTFAAYRGNRNPVLGTYGPVAGLKVGISNSINPIPYHHRSGLNSDINHVLNDLKFNLQQGQGVGAINNAEILVFYTLDGNIRYLTYTHQITAG